MSISQRFMDIARQRLPKDTFDEIYAAAIKNERKAVIETPSLPVADKVDKPHVAAVIEAHVNNIEPPAPLERPHIAERIEERLDTVVGPVELGKLSNMIQNGDTNVKIIKRRMDTVVECEVSFLGKHFVCIYNQSRNTLITAYPKKKKKKKVRAGKKPRDWREQLRFNEEDDMDGGG